MRVWYNSDSDRWKMSVDNGSGSIIIKTFANLEELETYKNLLVSQVSGEGSHNIGYDGHTPSSGNGLFSLSANEVDDTLDAICTRIDIEMKEIDNIQSGYLDLAGNNAMTGNLDMGDTNKIVNLSPGTNPTDAVNKAQLDAVNPN